MFSYELFKTEFELKQIKFQKNMGLSRDNINKNKRFTLEYWCDEGSSEISVELYTDEPLSKFIQDEVATLDDILNNTEGLIQNTKLFAGMIFDESIGVGKSGMLKGYQATSYFEKSAKKFLQEDRWLVEIYCKQGQKGFAMNGLNGKGFTKYPEEHEYLLPRNQKYIVISKDTKNQRAKILLID